MTKEYFFKMVVCEKYTVWDNSEVKVHDTMNKTKSFFKCKWNINECDFLTIEMVEYIITTFEEQFPTLNYAQKWRDAKLKM